MKIQLARANIFRPFKSQAEIAAPGLYINTVLKRVELWLADAAGERLYLDGWFNLSAYETIDARDRFVFGVWFRDRQISVVD